MTMNKTIIIPSMSQRQQVVIRELLGEGTYILEVYNGVADNDNLEDDSVSVRCESDPNSITHVAFSTFDSFLRKGLIQKTNDKPSPEGEGYYSNKYALTELGVETAKRYSYKEK